MSEQDAVERLDPDVLRANLDECAGDYAYQVTRRDGGERLSGVEVALIIAYGIAERTIDVLEASQQEVERLEQAVGWCQWGPTEDGGYNYFETSCGRSYFVVEGTLAENEYQHCPGCGGAIEEGTQDEQ